MKDRLAMEEKLAAYIEGTLSEEERLLVEERLKESEEMRESLSDLRKTIQLLQGLNEVDIPALYTEKIISKVRRETEQKKGILDRLFFPQNSRLSLQALAAIFLVVVCILIYKVYNPEPDRIRSTQPGVPTEQPQTGEVWGDIKIIVKVEDIDSANEEVQTAIRNLGGILLRKQSIENKEVLFVLLELQKVNDLYERLKPIGEINEDGDLSTVKGDVKAKIEIVKEHP